MVAAYSVSLWLPPLNIKNVTLNTYGFQQTQLFQKHTKFYLDQIRICNSMIVEMLAFL